MDTRIRSFDELQAETATPVVKDGPPTYAVMQMTGWLERQGFHPVLAAFLLFVISFLLFQGLATIIAIAMIFAEDGVPSPDMVMEVLENSTAPLLTGNTVGQFLGMALPVLIWTRLHTMDSGNFLRMKVPDPTLLILSGFGLFALLPCIQWLGQINETLPLPDFLVELEQAQMDLIERILEGDVGLGATVFALAITPAICEEILFRGYLQRQFERSMGVAGGIVLTGVLFGLYHFRLSQALPLAVLGIYLGYLVWRTGSIWVVVFAHFLNNGFAIAAHSFVAANPDLGIEDVEAMTVPISIVAAGAIVLALVIFGLEKRVDTLAGNMLELEASDG